MSNKINRVFSLKRDREYEDDKIRISYYIGEVSTALTVYLKDSQGGKHHVYWNIQPYSPQSFSKINGKVKMFVEEIINKWLEEQMKEEVRIEEAQRKQKEKEEQKLQALMDNF